MQFLEAVVIRGLIWRMSAATAVLSIAWVLPGIEPAWGQAVPGAARRGQTVTKPATVADADAPKLRCDEPSHDFGEVWSGEQVEHAFVIHNDGKSPLELLNVRPSCGCTVVDYDKVVAAGGEGKVTAKLNTTRMAHSIVKTVTVQSNDPANKMTTLTLKGSVKPRVSVEPLTANFGNVTEDKELVRTIKVTNHTEDPMKLERIPLPASQKSVFDAEITELEPGKVAEIKVKATPPFPEGSSSLLLRFRTGIEKEKEISLTCSLYSPPLIQVMPTLLPVTLPVPANYMRSVTIIYNGKDDFAIESAKSANDAISAEVVPYPPRPTNQSPGATGAQQGPKSYRLNVRIEPGFNPSTDQPIDIVMKTNLKERPELKVSVKPTRMVTPPTRQQTPIVARPEDLLGKPSPVSSLAPLSAGRVFQIGTNNQPAVLNFWAAWSSQSRRQAAIIQNLNAQYYRKGLTVVNIAVDPLKPSAEISKAAVQAGIALNTVALDPGYVTAAKFGIKSVPTTILIGKTGTVEAVHVGAPVPDQSEAYEQMLASELDLLIEGQTRAGFATEPKPATVADPMEVQVTGAASAGPRLTIESVRQNLGEVNPASQVDASVYVRNDGRAPLSITSVSASEGLELKPGYPTTLQPGAMGALACRFTAAPQPSSFEHKLTIASNDPAKSNVEIALVGEVKPYLQVQPETGIDFGRNPRTQTMGRMATILYNGTGEIEYLSAECSSPKFEAKVDKLGRSENAKLVVNPKPPFDLGELTAVVKVKTTCKQQPTVEVPIKLYNPKRIEVTPDAVLVQGNRHMQRYSITIANNGLEDLHILGLTKSNNRIRTQFYPDSDGFSYRLEVMLPFNYAATNGGDKITIRTDDKEFGEIVIPIKPVAGG